MGSIFAALQHCAVIARAAMVAGYTAAVAVGSEYPKGTHSQGVPLMQNQSLAPTL